jgi:hypothetical protein
MAGWRDYLPPGSNWTGEAQRPGGGGGGGVGKALAGPLPPSYFGQFHDPRSYGLSGSRQGAGAMTMRPNVGQADLRERMVRQQQPSYGRPHGGQGPGPVVQDPAQQPPNPVQDPNSLMALLALLGRGGGGGEAG